MERCGVQSGLGVLSVIIGLTAEQFYGNGTKLGAFCGNGYKIAQLLEQLSTSVASPL